MKTKFSISFVLLTLISFFLYGFSHFATDRSVLHSLHKFPQNALAYIDEAKNITIKPQEQNKLALKFIEHYFSPWNTAISNTYLKEIKSDLLEQYKMFEQKPGFGINTHIYNQAWITSLEKNIDLTHFPNSDQDAISIRDTNIRILPTLDPSFTDIKSVSKGYPFDNLQQTFIPTGTPIHIIHTSKDKAWYFVVACSYSGWIPERDLAFASTQFTKKWQTGVYAVSTQDNIPILDARHRLTTKTRIGVLYPVTKIIGNNFQILTPNITYLGNAVSKPVLVSKQFLNQFPLQLSNKNIAKVANNLMGKPYGWGGIYGYRDCSATTKDLMGTFGIWLPRHSSAQKTAGQYISISGLSNAQKEKKIIKHAIPFMTLIHLPGHVVLYIGEQKGHPIVFQNLWGLHIYKFINRQDRIVIGKTVITPLNFGKKFFNTSLNHLKAADGMTTLVTPQMLNL